MEKISVIIPTYNREKTILRALQSVLNQTYSNLEVLVIDDGSTDGTAEVVKGVEDSRVRYVLLKKNGGASNARNIGVNMASGEWIAFQDSDDCWHKDKLYKQMSYAHEHPEYAMIYCMYSLSAPSGAVSTVPKEPWPSIMQGNMLNTLLQRNVIGTPTMLLKRDAFLTSGGFNTDYKALEDWEYAIRFAKSYQIGFLPEILMDAYMLNNGVSSNFGAYFDGRCRILATYKAEMMEEGVFNLVMEDILTRAQGYGALELAKKLMMLYLSK